MRESNHSGTGVAVAALATGSLIGLAVGMLYAPKSGEENRRDLKNNYNATKSRMRYRAGRVKEAMRNKKGDQLSDSEQEKAFENSKLLEEQTDQ